MSLDYSLDKDFGFFKFEPSKVMFLENLEPLTFNLIAEAIELVSYLVSHPDEANQPDNDYEIIEVQRSIFPEMAEEMRESLKSLAAPLEFGIPQRFDLFIIRMEKSGKSSYAVTMHPQAGDQIAYVLQGHKFELWSIDGDHQGRLIDGTALLSFMSKDIDGDRVKLKVLTRIELDTTIGNDQLGDVADREILADIWIEKLNEKPWRYAPINLEIDYAPEDPQRLSEWASSQDIKAKWDAISHSWILA